MSLTGLHARDDGPTRARRWARPPHGAAGDLFAWLHREARASDDGVAIEAIDVPPLATEAELWPQNPELFDQVIIERAVTPGAALVLSPRACALAVPFSPAPWERSNVVRAALFARIGVDRLRALHANIDELYHRVIDELGGCADLAERSLWMLLDARRILLDAPEEYATAEYRTLQVRSLLDRTRRSGALWLQHGPRLLAFLVLWLGTLFAGLVVLAPLGGWTAGLKAPVAVGIARLFPLWSAMMWGGIGGAAGALFHLWRHVVRRHDFGVRAETWCVIQPVAGVVFGGIVYLTLTAGLPLFDPDLTVAEENLTTVTGFLACLFGVLPAFGR